MARAGLRQLPKETPSPEGGQAMLGMDAQAHRLLHSLNTYLLSIYDVGTALNKTDKAPDPMEHPVLWRERDAKQVSE